MEFAAVKIIVNPIVPVRQCGFITQTEPILRVHDDLYLRLALIKCQEQVLIYASLDNIGISEAQFTAFKGMAQTKFGKHTTLLFSCTHTHFGGDPKDPVYGAQLGVAFKLALDTAHLKEVGDITFAYRVRDYDEVGKSRISGHDATVKLETFSLYAENHRIATFIIHNVHPTIMDASTPYFSAEYPGCLLKMCSVSCPGEFFSFMQGADGDISTRFTRHEQTYDEVRRMAGLLHDAIEQMMKEEVELKPLDFIADETTIPITHEFLDPEKRMQGENITAREKQTIEYGRIVLEKLKTNTHVLPNYLTIVRIRFLGYTQLFAQNELFSQYLEALPQGKASLVCYTSGYRPYVAGLRPVRLTYELFSDTLSFASKELLYRTLSELSH
jgi:neutral ceramidase